MKMGLSSVAATFVTCLLFNIILPTLDVGTDLDLMYQTLNFNLGESLELDGCKYCYHRNEKEVYHPTTNLTNNDCITCIYDPMLKCGRNPMVMRKIREYQDEKKKCLANNSFIFQEYRVRINSKYEYSKCEGHNTCCVMQTYDTKRNNPIQNLDPKKVFWPCHAFRRLQSQSEKYKLMVTSNNFEFCYVAGNASRSYCSSFKRTAKFYEQLQKRVTFVENSSLKDTVFFYPLSLINQSLIIQEKNHSITDSEIKCGIVFFRHNIKYNWQRPEHTIQSYAYHCSEDVCLTHLKALHRDTSITNLTEWRKKTEYYTGRKVGGFTCYLLQIYGWSILIPIILNSSFSIVMFINDFRDQKATIFEIIAIFFAFYPQYKNIKFLAQYLFIHRNENILKEDKEVNDRTVANREPFLESCFQVRRKA